MHQWLAKAGTQENLSDLAVGTGDNECRLCLASRWANRSRLFAALLSASGTSVKSKMKAPRRDRQSVQDHRDIPGSSEEKGTAEPVNQHFTICKISLGRVAFARTGWSEIGDFHRCRHAMHEDESAEYHTDANGNREINQDGKQEGREQDN